MTLTSPTDSPSIAYRQALEFLASRVNYERWRHLPYGRQTLKLDRMRQLLDALGSPGVRLPIVHVAGTKGKGSVAAMVSAMLTAAGYRVGLYTSPHLHAVEERFRVDGAPCRPDELAALVDGVRGAVDWLDQAGRRTDPDDTGPTYFEITTAMAFLYFSQVQADVAVLEVGMGGRFDSTNVCEPTVAVITSISLDHTSQLGETLEQIAAEKAGIIKTGVPIVSGVVVPGPREVIRQVCRERNSRLVELGEQFDYAYRAPHDLQQSASPGVLNFIDRSDSPRQWRDLPLALPGQHQAQNAAVALATLAELEKAVGKRVTLEAASRGLASVQWPARVEVVARRPVQVVDAAHNVASVQALVETLNASFSVSRRHLLFAASEDKDVAGMLEVLLPRFDTVMLTRYTSSPRAIPPEHLQDLAQRILGRPVPVDSDPLHAWSELTQQSAADDLLCVTGSFFIASEIRQHLLDQQHAS